METNLFLTFLSDPMESLRVLMELRVLDSSVVFYRYSFYWKGKKNLINNLFFTFNNLLRKIMQKLSEI